MGYAYRPFNRIVHKKSAAVKSVDIRKQAKIQ